MSDSESSLDSELLAVAGRKKGGASGKKRSRKALSDSEEEDVSSEDVSLDDESDWEDMKASSKKRGSAQKPARKRPARGRAAKSEEEEEEEEEEEDSDDEDRLEIDEEDLIEDEEDRKRLAAMTELQREYELANRAEKRNQELLRQKLLKKGEEQAERVERAGAKAAKRVVRAKSGREEREEAAKKSAMEELKAARERKARGAEERARRREESEEPEYGEEEGRAGRRQRERDRSPSEEGMLESEDELSDGERGHADRLYGRHMGREEGEDEDEEAPVEDVKRIQVRRERLEQWVNEPFFEDTLPGCMVRIVAGEAPGMDGVPVRRYMLAQVVAVETRPPGVYKDSGIPWKSPYPFGPNNERTHKWLLVERGNSQRGMPLAQVSNSGFSDAEFDSWYRTCKEQGRPQVSRRIAKEVHDRLVKANTYTYTAEDVSRLLKEKKAKGQAPRNAALEKARLERELEYAREHEDTEKAAELEAQMAQLDALLEEGKGRRSRHNMASLNKRNADMNFKNALDNVSNKVGTDKNDSGAASQLDPFSRRATRPMIYWSTKRQGAGEEQAASQEPADGGATANGDGAAATAGSQQAEEAQQQQQQQAGKLDLDAIVDLSGLDLSILERPSRMPPLARKLLGPTWRPDAVPPNVRVISFEDYKRSKGWA